MYSTDETAPNYCGCCGMVHEGKCPEKHCDCKAPHAGDDTSKHHPEPEVARLQEEVDELEASVRALEAELASARASAGKWLEQASIAREEWRKARAEAEALRAMEIFCRACEEYVQTRADINGTVQCVKCHRYLARLSAPAPTPCQHSWVEEENEACERQMACELCGAVKPPGAAATAAGAEKAERAPIGKRPQGGSPAGESPAPAPVKPAAETAPRERGR